jgi:hypothetical protein
MLCPSFAAAWTILVSAWLHMGCSGDMVSSAVECSLISAGNLPRTPILTQAAVLLAQDMTLALFSSLGH